MSEVFKTVEDAAYKGDGRVAYCVRLDRYGAEKYPVYLRVDRNYDATWKVRVETNYYGLTPEHTDSDILDALTQAAADARLWLGRTDELEGRFQLGKRDREEEAKIEAAKAQVLRDADEAVGKKLAKMLIERMKVLSRETGRGWGSGTEIRMFERGTRRETVIKCTQTYGGVTVFDSNHRRVAKNRVIEMVADSHLDSLKVTGCPGLPEPKMLAFMMSKKK